MDSASFFSEINCLPQLKRGLPIKPVDIPARVCLKTLRASRSTPLLSTSEGSMQSTDHRHVATPAHVAAALDVAIQQNTMTVSELDRKLQKKMAPLHFAIFERKKLFANSGFAKYVAKTLEDFYEYEDVEDLIIAIEERSRPPLKPSTPKERIRRGSLVEVSVERQKDLSKFKKVCDKKLRQRLAREKDFFGVTLYNRLTQVVNDFDDWSNLQESLAEYEVEQRIQRVKLRPLLERNFNTKNFTEKHVQWMEMHKLRLMEVKKNRDCIVEKEMEHLKQAC